MCRRKYLWKSRYVAQANAEGNPASGETSNTDPDLEEAEDIDANAGNAAKSELYIVLI